MEFWAAAEAIRTRLVVVGEIYVEFVPGVGGGYGPSSRAARHSPAGTDAGWKQAGTFFLHWMIEWLNKMTEVKMLSFLLFLLHKWQFVVFDTDRRQVRARMDRATSAESDRTGWSDGQNVESIVIQPTTVTEPGGHSDWSMKRYLNITCIVYL